MIWYLPNLLIIFLTAYFLKPQKELQRVYWTGLLVKMLAGITLGYIYFTIERAGDTIAFHEKALEIYSLFNHSVSEYFSFLFTSHHAFYMSEARNELFIKIISLFYVLSGGNYWLCSLYLSLISFLGAWYLVLAVLRYYPNYQKIAFLSFLFFPTAVFWSSGVMKDTLVNGAILFLAGVSLHYYNKSRPFIAVEIVSTLLSLLLLFYLKYYLFAVVLLTLALLFWFQVSEKFFRSRRVKLLTSGVLFAVGILIISQLHANLNLDRLPPVIFKNYEIILEKSSGQNTLNFPHFAPSWSSMITHIPLSLFAGLFRPFPPEGNLSNIPAWVENCFLVVLFLMNCYFFKRIRWSPAVWLTLLYITILATLLPLTSPNFGTLIRYKISYLPFWVFLLSIIPYENLWLTRKVTSRTD